MPDSKRQQIPGPPDYSALQYAAFHLTGRSRAFLLQLEALSKELRLIEEEPQAQFLLDLIDQTASRDGGAGTVGHLEAEATKLLRRITGEPVGELR
ncbi:MAG: hypothetical protein ACREN8_10625 [Candidatus Dormibacteraceae bacterium]